MSLTATDVARRLADSDGDYDDELEQYIGASVLIGSDRHARVRMAFAAAEAAEATEFLIKIERIHP